MITIYQRIQNEEVGVKNALISTNMNLDNRNIQKNKISKKY